MKREREREREREKEREKEVALGMGLIEGPILGYIKNSTNIENRQNKALSNLSLSQIPQENVRR